MQCEAVLVMLLQRFDDIAFGAQLQDAALHSDMRSCCLKQRRAAVGVAEKWRHMADYLENYAR